MIPFFIVLMDVLHEESCTGIVQLHLQGNLITINLHIDLVLNVMEMI